MTVTKRQFTLLDEMGIAQWQRRERGTENHTENKEASLDFEKITAHPLFDDIIRSIGLSRGEIDVHAHYLGMGLINWQFSQGEAIDYQENRLTTPSLDTIALSPSLKRQLWQTFVAQKL